MPNQTLLDALKQAQWILDEILDDEKDRDGMTCLDNDLRDHTVKTIAMLSAASTTNPSTPERDSTIEECDVACAALLLPDVNAISTREEIEQRDRFNGAIWRCINSIRALKGKAAVGGDVDDARRWRETLRHIGGTHTDTGAQRFTLRYLSPVEGSDIMRGSIAGHFTTAIDAAIQSAKGEGNV
jgi:hypothetical protein